MIFGIKPIPDGPSEVVLEHAGQKITVHVRRTDRVKRMKLEILQGRPVLTLNPRIPLRSGIAFASKHTAWMIKKTAAAEKQTAFKSPLHHGGKITLLGIPYTIEHRPDEKGGVTLSPPSPLAGEGRGEGILIVTGKEEHIRRRILDFAKELCRKYIRTKVKTPFAVKDTATRWGSCSSKGNLNFSYRLIFAPKEVMDYIIVHEKAHLKEMNHGPRFWKLVETEMPDYKIAEKWLKKNGGFLHLY